MNLLTITRLITRITEQEAEQRARAIVNELMAELGEEIRMATPETPDNILAQRDEVLVELTLTSHEITAIINGLRTLQTSLDTLVQRLTTAKQAAQKPPEKT